MKNRDGLTIYRGDWKNDFYEGNGELYNEDPKTIRGRFDYNNLDKIETFWTSYLGDFKQGTMEGFGSLHLTNKERIIGIFKEGKVHG